MQRYDFEADIYGTAVVFASEAGKYYLVSDVEQLQADHDKRVDYWMEKYKAVQAQYPNGAEGCSCLFDKDEQPVQWCAHHATLRNELAKYKAFWQWSREADKMRFEAEYGEDK